MSLIRVSFLSSIAVAVRVGSMLLLNKVLAVYVGPTGYALIGQFQSIVSLVVSVSGGLAATGVTKMTAEHFDDIARQHRIWKTAVRFSLIASLLAGLLLLIFREHLAESLLHRIELANVFVWLAATLPAMALNNLLLAVINGKKDVALYVSANITGSLVALAATAWLAVNFGLYGALVALAINPALTLTATATMVRRRFWFKASFLWGAMDGKVLRVLSGFGLMALTSALVVPVAHILVRDILTAQLGLAAAGYWQAAWKMSEVYLMLVTSTLSVYYLPRLAEIRSAPELKLEVGKVYRVVIPMVIVGAIIIFLARDIVIGLLFTDEFLPVKDILGWQLAGDVVKIASWILAFIMIGRAMVLAFVVAEIAFSLSFVALVWIFVAYYGLVGVAIAYLTNYMAYWVYSAVVFYRAVRQLPRLPAR